MIYHQSVKLGENCYCYLWLGRGNNCNASLLCHALRGERPHVLIDPGHVRNELAEPCFDSLTEALGKDGFRVEDVGLMIGTHCHPDHFEASELLVQKSGALVALSREEDEFFRGVGGRFYGTLAGSGPQVKPLFFLGEGDLNLGGQNKIEAEVLLTPGHSPGSICLYLKNEKILISGDVVFSGSVGRSDFPGGSPSLLRKSIDRLSRLDVEYLVPGHGTQGGSVIVGRDRVRQNFQMVKMFA